MEGGGGRRRNINNGWGGRRRRNINNEGGGGRRRNINNGGRGREEEEDINNGGRGEGGGTVSQENQNEISLGNVPCSPVHFDLPICLLVQINVAKVSYIVAGVGSP